MFEIWEGEIIKTIIAKSNKGYYIVERLKCPYHEEKCKKTKKRVFKSLGLMLKLEFKT